MKKKNLVTFRLEECDEINLKESALQCGLTTSEYIRKCIKQEPVVKVYQPAELLQQISRIGNNINQIARHANITGNVSERSISEIRNDMNTIKLQVYKLIGTADVLCQ